MEKNILVLTNLEEHHINRLKEAAPECRFTFAKFDTVIQEQVWDADIILGNPPPNMLKGCTHLGMLCLNSAGSNNYCGEGILPEGILFTNATGAYGLMISEWLLGMLLSIYNYFPQYKENQRKNLWQRLKKRHYTVSGSTVLIIGAGDIGSRFARHVKALGAYTIGIRRTPREKPDFLDEVYVTADIDELLPRADVVALCLPSTGDTYQIINKARLARMREDAVLLNVGRGTAIDTNALSEHLASGKLLGVGMDVTDPEPLPPDSPLWQMPNVHITPHVSGSSSFDQAKDVLTDIFCQNLKAYFQGGKFRNIVDISTGYRKLED